MSLITEFDMDKEVNIEYSYDQIVKIPGIYRQSENTTVNEFVIVTNCGDVLCLTLSGFSVAGREFLGNCKFVKTRKKIYVTLCNSEFI